MQATNLRSFRVKVRKNKSAWKRFLSKLERNPPRGLDNLAVITDQEVWQEVDCLTCANCCKTMSPTFTNSDVKRIAIHLEMTESEFRTKWLRRDRNKDWININQPCQFLNLEDNKCSIYEVRPKDCSGFPHHTKKRMVDYMHVYKQNIEFCPATYKLVEKMKTKLAD